MKKGMDRICTGAAMLTAITMAMGNPSVLWAQQMPTQQAPMFSATARLVPISVSGGCGRNCGGRGHALIQRVARGVVASRRGEYCLADGRRPFPEEQ